MFNCFVMIVVVAFLLLLMSNVQSSQNYYYYTSLNTTANNKPLYYSPNAFLEPCENNTTPYPCFNKITIFSSFILFPNEKLVSFGPRGFDICHYYATRNNWNATKCYTELCTKSSNPTFQNYCMLCNVVSNEFRMKMWNVTECPAPDRRIDMAMTKSSDYDQTQICGSSKSSLLLLYLIQQTVTICYCEEGDYWASNCGYLSTKLAYFSYHYIIIILSFLISVFSFSVLLLPTLIQSRLFKKVRVLNQKLNNLVRVAFKGDERLVLSDSEIFLPKQAFSLKHFIFMLNLLIPCTAFGYFASRIALFIVEDFSNYKIILAIVFFLITISTFTICILWINLMVKELKKKTEDQLLIPLRVIYIVGLIFMFLVLAAYVITRILALNIGSGTILLVFMSILIVLGLAIIIAGFTLYYKVTRVKKDNIDSFVSMKFTRFIVLITTSFIILCVLLIIFSLENFGVNFIRGDLGLAIEFVIELVMIWMLTLITFYLYNHNSAMDTYEFLYWPIVGLFKKKKTPQQVASN
ncbi:predicted protein [Naegleria gruberi]|uniref:Predicted protein n=1 Tax=Naegleria gruberi TaxID=5762 RepID=D2W2F7_NAEGR|nr:uncharacterized protein NAEGRDRAFT_75572 [Naegleria gruberi]EFC36740.1 predicted protein [Naegleria gruberi]|eukprot:XP_002669484.1 predicted protein [Naegleria gruberi strain NEG-M]